MDYYVFGGGICIIVYKVINNIFKYKYDMLWNVIILLLYFIMYV